MTEMIYRPQTNERQYSGKPIIKTPFRKVPMDALVVEKEELPEFESEGWFSNPDEMFEEKEEIPVETKANTEDSGDPVKTEGPDPAETPEVAVETKEKEAKPKGSKSKGAKPKGDK